MRKDFGLLRFFFFTWLVGAHSYRKERYSDRLDKRHMGL